MTETTKPKRRWFQVSLRTFLVLILVIGGWIGWNLYEVRQRESYRKLLASNAIAYSDNPPAPWRMRKMPMMWQLFGAVPVGYIRLDASEGYGMSDAVELAKWFPEANVLFFNNGKMEWVK